MNRYSSTLAWDALQTALEGGAPACLGDDRFTDDGHSSDVTADLVRICSSCPILSECRTYATNARSHNMSGFWGAKWRGKYAEDD